MKMYFLKEQTGVSSHNNYELNTKVTCTYKETPLFFLTAVVQERSNNTQEIMHFILS